MEQYLSQCLNSVLNQTLRDIEVICVDDGSTDISPKILAEYHDKDDRIKIIQQINQGSGVARNNGIQHSSGEYIAFMDPDDFYPDEITLETLYQTAKTHNVKICGGSATIWNGKEFVSESDRLQFTRDGYYTYNSYQYASGYWRFIYDHQWLNEKRIEFPNYRRGQDLLFLANAMIAAESFYALSKITYCWRRQHKVIGWDKEKANDYLSSIVDMLIFSRENKLAKLHLIYISTYFNHILLMTRKLLYIDNPTFVYLRENGKKASDFKLAQKGRTKLLDNCHYLINKLFISHNIPIPSHTINIFCVLYLLVENMILKLK